MRCPNCNQPIADDATSHGCGWSGTRARQDAPLYPELAAFFAAHRNGATCQACGEEFPGTPAGPFDGGHWLTNHLHDHHPELYEQRRKDLGLR